MKLFNKNMSKQIDKKITWQDCVHEGVKILEENGIATKELADAIFESTKQYGAYYVLEKGLALLHAPSGAYNKKVGMSLLLLPENIQFNNEDKWARVILTLSAVDQVQHMELIQEFGELFMDHDVKHKLLNAKDLNEFFCVYEAAKGGVHGN